MSMKRRPTKLDSEMLKLTKDAALWTRRSAQIAILGVLVSLVALVVGVLIAQPSGKHEGPIGVVVNTVPVDPIGGAPIFPVASGGRPNSYLPAGQSLFIDCVQPVKPHYLFARISDGPYMNHWIDIFDVKTPRGEDVRHLKPLLPFCGPEVTLEPVPTVSP
jgi:hypothetical protein